jgi:hypothetical protein
MASKSQKYNASVNFGATVDPSMGRTLNRLTSGIEHIGAETSALTKTQTAWQRQMKAGSASTVTQMKHMERATQALISKHEALEKEIRDSVKNGRAGTAFLIADYKKVGAGIENARREMEKLTEEQERESSLARKQQRRDARRERFGSALSAPARSAWASAKAAPGNALESGLSMVGGLPFAAAKAAITAPIAIAKAGAAAGAGLIGSVVALNHKTAEEYRLSQQYGMSYRHYKAGSILAEQAGLNGENYGDLTEELSNKLGEQGNDKTLNPMLWQLGIAGKSSLKGTKQEQFDKVMKSISSNVYKGNLTAQQGESLADQLMGGEANKLMTYILSTGKSYEEVMKNADRLNNISEDEAKAAVESSQTISNLWTSGETALQGMAGELGKAFQPQLEAWEQQATAWVSNNKKLIVNDITAWVDGGGPERVVNGLETLGRGVAQVVKWIEEILPDNRDPAEMETANKARNRGMALADEEASERGLGLLSLDRFHLESRRADEAEQAWKDAHTHARVPDYATFNPEDIGGAIPTPTPSAQKQSSQQTNHFNITVNAAPGQSPEEVGQGVYQTLTGAFADVPDIPGADTFDAPSL